ncbi:MAG: ABC transporter substrate-binding protein [Candidatus Binatia bacterium]
MEKREVSSFRFLSFSSGVLLFLFLLLAFPLSGQAKTALMFYTSVPANVITPIIEQFNKKNPDIDLQKFRAGTNKIVLKVKTDLQSTGKVQADLIWVADPAYFMDLKSQGLLLKYASPKAGGIPAVYKDPDGYFTAGRILNMGITYNTNLVKAGEAPRDWTDLLDPKWKGQIGMPDPHYSGSTLDTVEALSSKYGWDFFKKLRKNGLIVIKGSSGTVRKVAGGDVKLAIALDFITRKIAAKGSPLGFNYPKSGAVSIASPVAIIGTTKHPAEAKRFIDFILSDEGQKAVVEVGRLYAVNPCFAPPKGAPPFKGIAKKALPINWENIKKNRDKIIKRFADIVQK